MLLSPYLPFWRSGPQRWTKYLFLKTVPSSGEGQKTKQISRRNQVVLNAIIKIKQDDMLERFEELFRLGNQGKLSVFNVDLNHEIASLLKEVREKLSRREECSSKAKSGT